jgi:Leucine-rich repeat (LRR) protein
MNKEKIVAINNLPMKQNEVKSLQPSDILTVNISFSDIKLPFNRTNFDNLMVFHASFTGLQSFDDIGNETFPSLKWFNVSNNAISTMKSILFDHMKELELVDLSFNCLTHFVFGIELIKHENIKKLNLQGNLLKSFSAGFLSNIKHLSILDLSFNQLESFKSIDHVFDELLLNNNQLESIEYIQRASTNQTLLAQFNNLTKLESNINFSTLNLSHNQFKDLHSFSIGSVYVLDLSHNQIKFDEKSALNSIQQLYYDEYEDDSGSILTTIESPVQYFNLSYNKIDKINDILGLERFKNAESLDLEGNFITEVDHDKLLIEFPKLEHVSLINNPMKDHEKKRLNFHSMNKIRYELEAQTEASTTTTTSTHSNNALVHLLLSGVPTLPPIQALPLPITESVTMKATEAIIAKSEEHLSDSEGEDEDPINEVDITTPKKVLVEFEKLKQSSEESFNQEAPDFLMKPPVELKEENSNSYVKWIIAGGGLTVLVGILMYIAVTKRESYMKYRRGQRRLIEFENFS